VAFRREVDSIQDRDLKRKVMELITEWERKGRREGRKAGRLEGRLEGRSQGRKQGRQEGGSIIVLRQLDRRLGPLPAACRERIGRLTVPQLEALAEALFEFATVEDLEQWLLQTGA
jgi:predicted transposase YdaD